MCWAWAMPFSLHSSLASPRYDLARGSRLFPAALAGFGVGCVLCEHLRASTGAACPPCCTSHHGDGACRPGDGGRRRRRRGNFADLNGARLAPLTQWPGLVHRTDVERPDGAARRVVRQVIAQYGFSVARPRNRVAVAEQACRRQGTIRSSDAPAHGPACTASVALLPRRARPGATACPGPRRPRPCGVPAARAADPTLSDPRRCRVLV